MIEVNNLTKEVINASFLKKVAKRVLEEEKAEGNLSIAVVNPEEIKELNKKYRKKDKATDVLSFGEVHQVESSSSLSSLKLMEVVLCPEVIKENAIKNNSSFEKELAFCLIHGVLHILGYSHECGKIKRGLMEEREKYYLSLFYPWLKTEP